jgi:large subunit ribosomal protein L1
LKRKKSGVANLFKLSRKLDIPAYCDKFYSRRVFMEIKGIDEAISEISQKKRKFVQGFDLIINLKNIDMKKPENKFSKNMVLPHGRGKDIEVAVISDSIPNALRKSDIEGLGKDKAKAKDIIKKYEFFLCEAPLMPLVGKVLGRYLGPKNKMPVILPPGADANKMMGELKKSVRIGIRDSPTIHVYVGREDMDPAHVKKNIEKVIAEVKKSLPAKVQIKNIYLKLTMSKPVRIG